MRNTLVSEENILEPRVFKHHFYKHHEYHLILKFWGNMLMWALLKSLCSSAGQRPSEQSSFATVGSGKHAQGVLKRQWLFRRLMLTLCSHIFLTEGNCYPERLFFSRCGINHSIEPVGLQEEKQAW